MVWMETTPLMTLGLGPKPNGLPKMINKLNNKEKPQNQVPQPHWMMMIGI